MPLILKLMMTYSLGHALALLRFLIHSLLSGTLIRFNKKISWRKNAGNEEKVFCLSSVDGLATWRRRRRRRQQRRSWASARALLRPAMQLFLFFRCLRKNTTKKLLKKWESFVVFSFSLFWGEAMAMKMFCFFNVASASTSASKHRANFCYFQIVAMDAPRRSALLQLPLLEWKRNLVPKFIKRKTKKLPGF